MLKPLHLALSFLCASLSTAPALARKQAEPAPEPQRWSLEAGIGANVLIPYLSTRLTYRLPVLQNQIDVFLEAQPFNPVIAGSTGLIAQELGLGGRYYFATEGGFRPYATLLTGLNFTLTDQPTGVGTTRPAGLIAPPFLYIGAGADFMWNEHWGLNLQLLGGAGGIIYIPQGIGIRPEVNLKYVF